MPTPQLLSGRGGDLVCRWMSNPNAYVFLFHRQIPLPLQKMCLQVVRDETVSFSIVWHAGGRGGSNGYGRGGRGESWVLRGSRGGR